jgi:hypothetical protein
MHTTQTVEVKQLVAMDRATKLKKLAAANRAIAEISYSYPSDHAHCLQLIALEQGIFDLEEEIAEAD